MKTPMEELIESLLDYQHESHETSVDIEKLIENINEMFLEKEKKMVVNAYADGCVDSSMTEPVYKYAESYYNEKFSK